MTCIKNTNRNRKHKDSGLYKGSKCLVTTVYNSNRLENLHIRLSSFIHLKGWRITGAIHTWLDCWWCNIFGNRTMLLNQNDGTFSGTDRNFEIWKNLKRHLQASQHNGALYNGAWSLFLNLLIFIAWTNGGIYLHAFKQYHSPKQCLLSARPEEHIKWNEMYYDERWGRWMDP